MTDETDVRSTDALDALPLDVGYAAAFLDGWFEGERPEAKRNWQTVRAHLLAIARPLRAHTDGVPG